MRPPAARVVRLLVLSALCVVAAAGRAEAQLGRLVSPGPLAKAHAVLEGASQCGQCHDPGRKVTPEKCLTCHAPVAKRLREKRGVHKDVTECVSCHVDHAGVNGELRPFDTAKFNHAAVTGFALDGRHAPLAARCESCHKTRSFLTTNPDCVTCHADVHKGALGPKCVTCHPVSKAFKDAKTSFDHSVTKFPLLGAHRKVGCAQCHVGQTFTIAKFSACLDCHKTPHPASVSTACTSCHTNDNWHTKKFDHDRTAFPLRGEHASVDCAACHKEPATRVKPPSSTCAACHVDPHKGEFRQDCKSCHAETGWANAPFDHRAGTASHFALADGHANLSCVTCHTSLAASSSLPVRQKTIDFRGQAVACASCHTDVHQGELGTACETCHTVRTFTVTTFTHPGAPEFYAGGHATLACEKCHQQAAVIAAAAGTQAAAGRFPVAPSIATKHTAPLAFPLKATPTRCATCHADPHLGQVGTACESCHSVAGLKFTAERFAHTRSRFALVGKHRTVECATCHKTETGAFPAGRGTATRYTGLETTCRSCHADVHLGQVALTCETCHSTDSFKIAAYEHRRPLPGFFVGSHKQATCAACHKTVTGRFPAGRGTAVQFRVGTTCVSCHTDAHNGALGSDCGACHKPQPRASAHRAEARP